MLERKENETSLWKYPIKLQLLAIAKVGRSGEGKLNTNFI